MHHTTVIHWVKLAAKTLSDAPEPAEIPDVTQLDELETFVGSKKIWLWTAVNKHTPGILALILGNRSAESFKHLWQIVK